MNCKGSLFFLSYGYGSKIIFFRRHLNVHRRSCGFHHRCCCDRRPSCDCSSLSCGFRHCSCYPNCGLNSMTSCLCYSFRCWSCFSMMSCRDCSFRLTMSCYYFCCSCLNRFCQCPKKRDAKWTSFADGRIQNWSEKDGCCWVRCSSGDCCCSSYPCVPKRCCLKDG